MMEKPPNTLLEQALTVQAEHGVMEAYATLSSWLTHEELHRLGEILLVGQITMTPPAPLFRVVEEAESWATTAGPVELRAYCWACAKRLPIERRAAFVAALFTHSVENQPICPPLA